MEELDFDEGLVALLRLRLGSYSSLDEVRISLSRFFGVAKLTLFGSNRYQIFAPILALQLVNSFWSYLIWRYAQSPLKSLRVREC
jgi:hypothetical protein